MLSLDFLDYTHSDSLYFSYDKNTENRNAISEGHDAALGSQSARALSSPAYGRSVLEAHDISI